MEKNTSKNQKVKEIALSWIVVSDLPKATKFFTECVGLKISQASEEYGWVELSGYEGGATLGLAAVGAHNPISPGHNAITTFTVDNIEKATADFSKKGVKLIGEIMEVPGHVKLQLFADLDGNKFQLVEDLSNHTS